MSSYCWSLHIVYEYDDSHINALLLVHAMYTDCLKQTVGIINYGNMILAYSRGIGFGADQ